MIPDVSLLVGRSFVSRSNNVCKFRLAVDTEGDPALELVWENEVTVKDIDDAEEFVQGVIGVPLIWKGRDA